MFSLSAKVKEQFTERIARLSDTDLQNHQKVMAFKDSIKNSLNQGLNYMHCYTHSGLLIDFGNSWQEWYLAKEREGERNYWIDPFFQDN